MSAVECNRTKKEEKVETKYIQNDLFIIFQQNCHSDDQYITQVSNVNANGENITSGIHSVSTMTDTRSTLLITECLPNRSEWKCNTWHSITSFWPKVKENGESVVRESMKSIHCWIDSNQLYYPEFNENRKMFAFCYPHIWKSIDVNIVASKILK